MARSRRNSNIIRNKAKIGKTMNRIEFLIFGFIIIYLFFYVIKYFKSEPMRAYEVTMGSLSISKNYTGFAIRDEEIVEAPKTGYINYFVREKERVSTRDSVFSIDESGYLEEILRRQNTVDGNYTNEELLEMKNNLINFNRVFEKKSFSNIYDFKYELEGDVIKLVNESMYEGIEEMNRSNLGGMVNLYSIGKTGYVVFNTDGYEDISIDDIDASFFNLDSYDKKRILNNELIEAGNPACKVVTNEKWSLVIPVDEERAKALEEAEYVKVKFVKNQESSWASVKIIRKSDGIYAELSFSNSCITFCNERYVEIELIINDKVGLKIPNSAIIEKEFFIIPAGYVKKGGKDGQYSVLKEFFDENGNVVYNSVDVTIYNSNEEEFYVDNINLSVGDYILMPTTMDKIPISKSGKLIGVYNMNKGYADFKQIKILYQNDEYSIISSNTNLGLTVYDRIVLNASSVNNDDFTYHKK